MSAFLAEWLRAIWAILCESGPFLIGGFFLAGLIKVLIPEEKIHRHLGKDDLRSVTLAALYGAPLPLCSCSVLPTAMALKRAGASKGATTSFLISTPETGVDSIGVTWALMDPLMTVARPIAAILTAIGAGSIVNWMVRRKLDVAPGTPAAAPAAESCCHDDHDHAHVAPAASPARRSRLLEAVRYAFGTLLDDLVPWFVLGFLVSGLITVLVPADFFGSTIPNGWPSMLIMLVLGVPLYVCASASTPVAAALVAKGLDPGAALVFLLAGPATNFATILVAGNLLGRRVMFVYVASIAVFSLLAGWVVSGLYSFGGIVPMTSIAAASESGFSLVARVSGVVLLTLFLASAVRIRLDARFGAWLRGACRPLGFDPTGRVAKSLAVLAIVAAYASTAFSVVNPGETAFLLRCGRIAQRIDAPGLVTHWPYPIDSVAVVRRDEIRSVELGFDRTAASNGNSGAATSDVVPPDPSASAFAAAGGVAVRDLDAEAEVMTGEEKLLKIADSIHFDVRDPSLIHFGVDDPDLLMRSFAESSVRQVIGNRGADETLVGQWDDLEKEIGSKLQSDLDRVVGSGALGVRGFLLLDAHAPPQVHYAYRDVASALEDKDRELRRADKYRRETLANARAEAVTIEKAADGDKELRLAQVTGEATAFAARAKAFRESERVSRLRLARESLERALARVRAIVLMSPNVDPVLMQSAASGGESAMPSSAAPRVVPRDASSSESGKPGSNGNSNRSSSEEE